LAGVRKRIEDLKQIEQILRHWWRHAPRGRRDGLSNLTLLSKQPTDALQD
jgi:hypothetical protein